MSRRFPSLALGRPFRAVGAAAIAVIAVAAFGPGVAAVNDGAAYASAELHDTTGNLLGWAHFTEDATGIVHVSVHVSVHVKGLSAGLHGTHIHATGVCTLNQTPVAFASAGSHYNPPPPQLHGSHAGDLPNPTVNRAGVGHLNATTDRAALSEFIGLALIIHQGPDDHVTNPTGNSGARIACGVIG